MTPKSLTPQDTSEPLNLVAEVQQVLDKLWKEKAIPFALNVGKLTQDTGEYTIHFHDARIRTARVPITKGHSRKESVREAVLARVSQMSGPLPQSPQKHQ
jgi:diadenosine tetraphosphate (Ap4A) HIT family hydrolase